MIIKDLIFSIDDVTFDDAVSFVIEKAKKKDKKTFVITINTEIVMHARGDSKYEKVLKSADYMVNDSIGLTFGRKIYGKSSKKRIHGVDFVDQIAGKSVGKGIEIGFLGAGKGIAKKTAEILKNKYPGLKTAFIYEEWPDFSNQQSAISNQPKCDILFVAFGSPKQEKWIYENLSNINTNVAIGVGGAFDFISGNVRRAPKWVRSVGLEWLFRLVIQPWRIKRQLKLFEFVMIVIKERIIG